MNILSTIMQNALTAAVPMQNVTSKAVHKSPMSHQPVEPAFAEHLRDAVSVTPASAPKISSEPTLDDPQAVFDAPSDDNESGGAETSASGSFSGYTPSSVVELEEAALAEPEPTAETYEALLNSVWDELAKHSSAPESGISGITDSILMMLLSMHPDLSSSDGGSMGGVETVLALLCGVVAGGDERSGSAMDCVRALVDKLPEDQAAVLRQSLMNSDNLPVVLDKIDKNVFTSLGMYPGGSTWSGGGVTPGSGKYPYEAWRKCEPAVVSTSDNRSAMQYRAVIDQFSVESNGRYKVNKKGTGDTYCNIFLWDVTSAMNAEIPHYIDKATKAPRTYPDVEGAMELNANATYDWLMNQGPGYGWIRVTPEQAQMYANQGRPAVTAKKNAGGIGHVQVVSPSANGTYDPIKGVTVAQAGSRLRNYTYITEIYGGNALSQVAYFVHL